MNVIIPCAGYATRLWPLTKDKPKALLTIKDKPILSHIIKKLEPLPVSDIFIVTNAKFYNHFKEWHKKENPDKPIEIIDDNTTSNEDRLGQIGDINLVLEQKKINDDVLIIAGDNLFNFSLRDIYESFLEKNNVFNALYDVKSIGAAKELGVVEIEEGNEIIHFEEKPENPRTTYASLGIYFFPKDRLRLIRQYLDEGNSPDKMGYFMTWILNKEKVHGYLYKEKWFDIGWKESLEQAQKEFKE